ncbi:hypothetical protein KDL45_04470 [bacterium]|nr:hypothetical protein [bacterium]
MLTTVVWACSRDQVPPPPAPVEEASPTPTPSMPLPGTSTPATPANPDDTATSEETPFSYVIYNAYLVDPDINPVGVAKTREKGIRLFVRGRLRNNTDRVIYRAGVFGKLVVNFDKNVKLEKHSGGLGFDPAITSSNPWRPGTWRDFSITTRAFDPIYREFDPKTITGVISLEAKDPLDYTFKDEIGRLRPMWETLFGAVVASTVQMNEDTTVEYGPNRTRTNLKENDEVELVAQQGAAYLALKNGLIAGWIPEAELRIQQYQQMYPDIPLRTFPMIATVPGKIRITALDYLYETAHDGLPAREEGYMALKVQIQSLAERQTFTVSPDDFWIDQGSGRFAEGFDNVKNVEGALPDNTRLAPGEEVTGWIFIPRRPDGWPFALVFQTRGDDPAHIMLLPAVGRRTSETDTE